MIGKATNTLTKIFYAWMILSIGFLSLPLRAEPSSSDKYCAYLQEIQAKAQQEKKELSAIESIINFVNDLTKKITLEALEKEALSKKMSFEEFQKWASDAHSIKVNDHYKAKYLKSYIKTVCGEITYKANFGATPEPEVSSSAEKQFDPTGHPYSAEVIPPPQSSPPSPSQPLSQPPAPSPQSAPPPPSTSTSPNADQKNNF